PVPGLPVPNPDGRQTYTLTRVDVDANTETVIGTDLPVAPAFVGPASMPDYNALAQSAIQNLPGGYKVFVGPRDDPFFVDLAAVFDLLSVRPHDDHFARDLFSVFDPATLRGGPHQRDTAVDGLGGFNVMSIVLQVPKTALTKDGAAPDPAR